MKIVYREAVEADLADIFAWIAKDDVAAARGVVRRIIENIERLGRLPGMGHAGGEPGTLEWVVPRLPYIVVYTVDVETDVLEVIAVFHTRRDR
jgi:toxin ParE1/3/4